MLIAEYLEREFHAPTRSEFVDGELLDMAGAREPHILIVGNTLWLIRSALEGKPCRVYSTELRVRIKHRPRYRYPDLAILCSPTEFDESDARKMSVTNPRVIIEVLSDSTEREDRGRKFHDYRSIDSFEEYLLISQDEPRVESFRKQPDGDWKITTWDGRDSVARIDSLAIDLPLKKVYEHITLPELPSEDSRDTPT
jgi:Uma2 family endonuclease